MQVITEDSDMLAYGCPQVLFKMDKTGTGQEICMARLPEARTPSFVGFSSEMFLEVSTCFPHVSSFGTAEVFQAASQSHRTDTLQGVRSDLFNEWLMP